MRSFAKVTILTVLLAACTDIISPPRVTIYEYRLLIPDGEGGIDPLAFHWPREMLPVRIWIADDDDLRPALLKAMATWENSFLYGEFRSELVASEAEADIIVRNTIAPPKLASQVRLASMADECRGETTFLADAEEETLTLPFEVYVSPRTGPSDPNLAVCYELTVLHELGHALGVFAHSPNPDDLMYADPTRNGLSERDRATAEAAYHLPTTLRPVR
jgi:predicted Zn-dependent protease